MDIKKVDTAAVSPNDEKADRTGQTGDIYILTPTKRAVQIRGRSWKRQHEGVV